MGWSGDIKELQHVLRTLKCDQTEEGEFKVDGKIVLFMGVGPDVVVGDDAVYYFDGKPHNLAHAMHGTSYGMKVTVI